MIVDIILAAALVLAALVTVMVARLIGSVIALAVTSAVVTIAMFRLSSPIAAVFELSVCAGLIPAIFITVIGLTQRLTPEGLSARKKEKLRRFWLLPLIVVFAGMALSQVHVPLDFAAPAAPDGGDVRTVLWIHRHTELLGQIVMLLGGVFGVVALVMESKNE